MMSADAEPRPGSVCTLWCNVLTMALNHHSFLAVVSSYRTKEQFLGVSFCHHVTSPLLPSSGPRSSPRKGGAPRCRAAASCRREAVMTFSSRLSQDVLDKIEAQPTVYKSTKTNCTSCAKIIIDCRLMRYLGNLNIRASDSDYTSVPM